jgi:hypothetical protein
MRDEPRSHAKHKLEHVVPTVIHDPEEKMPVLARWLRHAMENQTRFWSLIALLVVAVTGLAIVSNGLSLGRSASDAAWLKIEKAKTASERVEFAREFAGTAAEQWALLQAATEFYNQGFVDLPANRDAALLALGKALKYFDQVAREAPQDSPQARAAALGAARTLEARNELEKAIKQYEKVVTTWKGTPEAAEAQRQAEVLRRPENVAFYKELYSTKTAELTLPAGGQGSMTLSPDHPPIGGTMPSPLSVPLPPPLSGPILGPAGTEASKAKAESDFILLPPPPPAPKGEQKPKPDASKGDLPSDPFLPKE